MFLENVVAPFTNLTIWNVIKNAKEQTSFCLSYYFIINYIKNKKKVKKKPVPVRGCTTDSNDDTTTTIKL